MHLSCLLEHTRPLCLKKLFVIANPLMLLPAIGVWFGGLRRVLRVYHLANLAVVVLTMLAWEWLPQQANAAFFALMPVTALRSINFFVNN